MRGGGAGAAWLEGIDAVVDTEDEGLGGSAFSSNTPRSATAAQRKAMKRGVVRRRCNTIVCSSRFEAFILACVCLNTALMAIQHFGQPDGLTRFSRIANFAFAMIFNVEAAIKLYALRRKYFGANDAFGSFSAHFWNIFDLVIVMGTDIGLVVKLATGVDSVGSVGLVVRACRIGRVLRLANAMPGMKELFDTLAHTAPGLCNVGALLLLILFIYAAVGVQLFSRVGYNGSLNAHCNFRTIGSAILALLRFTTGENSGNVMHDLTERPDGCDADPQFAAAMCGFSLDFDRLGADAVGCAPLNGCGTPLAIPYFVSFMLAVPFVFLNLFIAVILEAFYDTKEEDMAGNIIGMKQMVELWDGTCAYDGYFVVVKRRDPYMTRHLYRSSSGTSGSSRATSCTSPTPRTAAAAAAAAAAARGARAAAARTHRPAAAASSSSAAPAAPTTTTIPRRRAPPNRRRRPTTRCSPTRSRRRSSRRSSKRTRARSTTSRTGTRTASPSSRSCARPSRRPWRKPPRTSARPRASGARCASASASSTSTARARCRARSSRSCSSRRSGRRRRRTTKRWTPCSSTSTRTARARSSSKSS